MPPESGQPKNPLLRSERHKPPDVSSYYDTDAARAREDSHRRGRATALHLNPGTATWRDIVARQVGAALMPHLLETKIANTNPAEPGAVRRFVRALVSLCLGHGR